MIHKTFLSLLCAAGLLAQQFSGLGQPGAVSYAGLQAGTALYVAGSGSAAAQTGSVTPSLLGFTTGQVLYFRPSATSTGGMTLNINSLGGKSILRADGSALQAGDLVANALYAIWYDGTSYRLLGVQAALGSYVVDPGGNGIVIRTGSGTSANRTLVGTSGKISVTNGDGVSGNPQINIGADIVDSTSTYSNPGWLLALDGGKITTGTVPAARLGSGTANNTTVLFGDQVWRAVSTDPNTNPTWSALASGTWCSTGGTSTAYTCLLTPTLTGRTAPGNTYANGMQITLKAHAASGASPTLNIDSAGARRIYAADGTSDPALTLNEVASFVFDSTLNAGAGGFRRISTAGSGGSALPCAVAVETVGDTVTLGACSLTVGLVTVTPVAVSTTATITSAPSGGTIWIGVTSSNTIVMAHNLAGLTCDAGCTALSGQTSWPSTVVARIASVAVASGGDPGTVTDARAAINAGGLIAGTNVTITDNLTTGTRTISSTGGGAMARDVVTATGTWTRPSASISRVYVQAWAGGGGGASGAVGENGGAGGGGGGYAEGWCEVSGDVSVTIGAGGVGGDTSGSNFAYTAGTAGGDTSFGTCLTALGGRGGTSRVGAAAGYRDGMGPGTWMDQSTTQVGVAGSTMINGATTTVDTVSGDFFFRGLDQKPGYLAMRQDQGGGGGGGTATAGYVGGQGLGGGGGGGAGGAGTSAAGAGGISMLGGTGGTGAGNSVACTAGSIPAGGGGGGQSPGGSPKVAGCNGARGEVRVFYVQ